MLSQSTVHQVPCVVISCW